MACRWDEGKHWERPADRLRTTKKSTVEKGECFMGTQCTFKSLDHFRMYTHNEQARQRSNIADFKECTIATKISEDIAKAAADSTQVATGSSSLHSPNRTFSHKNNQCKSNTEDYIFDDADGDTFSAVVNADESAVTGTCHSKIDNKFNSSTNHIMGNLNPGTQTSSVNNLEKKSMKNKFQTDLNSYFGVKNKLQTNAVSSLSTTTKDYGEQSFKQKRSCPFYKKIPGTSITVDAFNYGSIPGCTAYFLSHFHFDHYLGLKKTFRNNLYCSKITASLVCTQLKVDPQHVHTLPVNEEIEIEGVKVTLLDANHCPGSVMILFVLSNGQRILHTGDFRAVPSMWEHPALKSKNTDVLYLDTTYCSPEYNFPTQQRVIDFTVSRSLEALRANKRTLIVCGTYTIGKERIFLAIANALDCMIGVKGSKKKILASYKWPELEKRLSQQWSQSQIHLLPMNCLNAKGLKAHLKSNPHFNRIIAFKPTGWTHNSGIIDLRNIRPTVSGSVTIYGVPYSEHSSFSELESFVKSLKPSRIIPTVNNGSPERRKMMQSIFTNWLANTT
eukprot:gene12538-3233_t